MRWIIHGTNGKKENRESNTKHTVSPLFFQNDQENNPKESFLLWFDKIYLVTQSLKKARVAIRAVS
jgi:hypothetical protein